MSAAAFRLSGVCPWCGAELVVRPGKDGPFLGCAAYARSRCRFTAPYDEALAALHDELERLRAVIERPLRRDVDVGRELRALMVYAHPDRWPNANELATGIVARLSALRERVA